MARAGIVIVHLSPLDGAVIADWLELEPVALWPMIQTNVAMPPKVARKSLARKFRSFSVRKRKPKCFEPAAMELSRSDARWFSRQAQGGMFAGNSRNALPRAVRDFSVACLSAVRTKACRPKVSRQHLDAVVSGDIAREQRHVQRQKARQKALIARNDLLATDSTELILGRRLMEAFKNLT